MDCKIDQSKYGVPMPWIGLYITAASVACLIAMLGDFIWGIRRRRLWFPCKFFSLNATSLTLIAIATKLPVDLNNPMPKALEQLAKLSGTAFLCITMANFMTSVASMKASDVILNVVPLVILVITVVVNVCIQMGTGVIHAFLPEHIITMCFLLIMLTFTYNVALNITFLKLLAREHRESVQTSMSGEGESHHGIILKSVAKFKRDVKRYWMAILCTDRQYLSYSLKWGVATDILSILETGVLIQALVRTLKKGSVVPDCTSEQVSSSSDYRWSIVFILSSQVFTVVVGVLGPLYRILQMDHLNVERNFTELDANIDGDTQSATKMRLVEWFRDIVGQFRLVEWFRDIVDRLVERFRDIVRTLKARMVVISSRILTFLASDFDPLSFDMIQSKPGRRLIHCSKNVIVRILIYHQLAGFALSYLLLQLRRVMSLASLPFRVMSLASRPFSLKIERIMQQALFPFTQDFLVTELKSSFDTTIELRDFLNEVKTVSGVIDGVLLFRLVDANIRIREELSKNSLICLTNLLKVSNASGQQDPLVHDLDKSSIGDCWALRLVNVTSIAVLMPCTETTSPGKSSLLRGVGEGLKYVRFLDKHSKTPISVRKAVNIAWEDVELYHRWFEVEVSKFNSMENDPMEVIEWLEKMGKSYVEYADELGIMEKSPKALAGTSMLEICRSIREGEGYGFSSADEAYACLHRIICNILAARLMDLREALHVECYSNAFEGKEERVQEVAYLLSMAENTVEVLEKVCDREHPVITKWKYDRE